MVDVSSKIQALWLLPPGSIIIAALLGFLIQIRWFFLGSLIIFLSIAALLMLSLPLTGSWLMQGVESRFPPLSLPIAKSLDPPPGAIVILGAGRYVDAVEYGEGDSVNRLALERLRYGAYLQRLTGLPILVSGGAPYGESVSEAALMRASLVRDFQIEVKWVEDKSDDTFENAKYSKKILAAAGVRRVYLVTHAAHMPRAVWSFETAGLSTLAAPMGFSSHRREGPNAFGYIPSAKGMSLSSGALYERLGLMWYKHKYPGPKVVADTAPLPAR